MKNIFILIITILLLSSCADNKVIEVNGENKLFKPYGLVNEERVRNDSVYYEISPESIVWSIVLCETIIAPVYLIGWELYEPIEIKKEIK